MKFLNTIFFSMTLLLSSLGFAKTGILILAHGVSSHDSDHMPGHGHHMPQTDPWEETVLSMVQEVREKTQVPVALSFGMWDQKNFQKGIDQLVKQDVDDLRVVPLFVSSHSDVIRAQHYMFGLREKNPLPFPIGRLTIPEQIKTLSVKSPLGQSPELTRILEKRALELSLRPESEELILVAHGPVADSDDQLWLQDLQYHADHISLKMAKHVLTVRDDADEDVRNEMTARFRNLILDITKRGKTPLILPVLIAQGGIDKGILKRLEGLQFIYKGHMLAPDEELVNWIIRSAGF